MEDNIITLYLYQFMGVNGFQKVGLFYKLAVYVS